MSRRSCRLAAGALSVALSVACTSTSGSPASGGPADASSRAGAEATTTAAAELRAGLTYLLTEHVFDVAGAAQALVTAKGNLDAMDVVETKQSLDKNSAGFASLVTEFSPSSHDGFLAAWQLRTGLLLQYAAAKTAGDEGEAVRMRVALDRSSRALSEDVHAFILPLPTQRVADELDTYVTALLTAIDRIAAHRPGSAKQLSAAAALMPRVAALLASGIAADKSLR